MSSKAWALIRRCLPSSTVKDLQTQLYYKTILYNCNTREVQKVHKPKFSQSLGSLGICKVKKQKNVLLNSENSICKCTRHERQHFLIATKHVSVIRAKNKSKGIWWCGLGSQKCYFLHSSNSILYFSYLLKWKKHFDIKGLFDWKRT